MCQMRAWIHQSERSWQAYWSQGLFSLFYMSHTEWVMVENIERLTTQNWHDVKYSRKMSKNCEKLTKRNLPQNHLTKKQMWLITVQLLDVEKYSIDWKDFVIILKSATVRVFRSFTKCTVCTGGQIDIGWKVYGLSRIFANDRILYISGPYTLGFGMGNAA